MVKPVSRLKTFRYGAPEIAKHPAFWSPVAITWRSMSFRLANPHSGLVSDDLMRYAQCSCCLARWCTWIMYASLVVGIVTIIVGMMGGIIIAQFVAGSTLWFGLTAFAGFLLIPTGTMVAYAFAVVLTAKLSRSRPRMRHIKLVPRRFLNRMCAMYFWSATKPCLDGSAPNRGKSA